MDFTLLLTLVTFLLERERRLSYRYIRRQFALDDEALEELRYELVDVRRLAVEEDAETLIWVGTAAASALADRSGEASAPKSPAHPSLGAQPRSTPQHREAVSTPTPLKSAQAERRLPRPASG